MKIYEKPTLVILSVTGNDLLCGACSVDVVGGGGPSNSIIEDIIKDFGETVFTSADSCEVVYDIEGYCKFSPNQDVVYNS